MWFSGLKRWFSGSAIQRRDDVGEVEDPIGLDQVMLQIRCVQTELK